MDIKTYVVNPFGIDKVSVILTPLNQLADKLNAPSTPGTSGQVLLSDGQGGTEWGEVQGGGGGTPTVVTLASQMTDHDVIYLYMGSETGYNYGDWYYWNGTAWTDGGAYGQAGTDYLTRFNPFVINDEWDHIGVSVSNDLNDLKTGGCAYYDVTGTAPTHIPTDVSGEAFNLYVIKMENNGTTSTLQILIASSGIYKRFNTSGNVWSVWAKYPTDFDVYTQIDDYMTANYDNGNTEAY